MILEPRFFLAAGHSGAFCANLQSFTGVSSLRPRVMRWLPSKTMASAPYMRGRIFFRPKCLTQVPALTIVPQNSRGGWQPTGGDSLRDRKRLSPWRRA